MEAGRCGAETSSGNAGWVVPPLSAPLPAPGVSRRALRMLLDRESPLRMKLRLNPNFLRWLWLFWRSSNEKRFRESFEATLALNERTLELYDELAESTTDLEVHHQGLLIPTLSREELDEYSHNMRLAEELGYLGAVEILGGDEARTREPALSKAVAGAVHAKDTRHIRPESLVRTLITELKSDGVQFLEGTRVSGLVPERNGEWKVQTNGEDMSADRVVVAAGLWSRKLLSGVGFSLPLEAGKGYSVTAKGEGERPCHPMKLAEVNIACTPFDEGVRISGMFELGARDTVPNPKTIQKLIETSSRYLRDWRPIEPGAQWAGMRPATPDDLPFIGGVPGQEGLYVAAGHGTLGLTLAPATGAALTPLILEDKTSSLLEPFRPDRFRRM